MFGLKGERCVAERPSGLGDTPHQRAECCALCANSATSVWAMGLHCVLAADLATRIVADPALASQHEVQERVRDMIETAPHDPVSYVPYLRAVHAMQLTREERLECLSWLVKQPTSHAFDTFAFWEALCTEVLQAIPQRVGGAVPVATEAVSYTHLRAHET